MERDEALLYRADLLQQIKGLELQRAGLLSIVNRIEKEYHIEKEGKHNDRAKSIASNNEDASRKNIEAVNISSLQSRRE